MPLSVLLVDDTVFLRSMLRELVEQSDAYRVVAEAADGVTALTLVPELRPDRVITDLIMPGLDGVELTRVLVDSDPDLRVILTAAGDQEGAVLNALAAGAWDFISKPYVAAEVRRILAGPPPLPPPIGEEAERPLKVRLALSPDTPLPLARARVVRAHCAKLGQLLNDSGSPPMTSPDPEASRSLELLLQARATPEATRGWVGRLPWVAEVVVEALPSPEEDAPQRPRPSTSAPPRGSLRLRACFLDRLLDHLDQMTLDCEELSRRVPAAPSAPEPNAPLRRLGRGVARMRSEILAARLVPFERVAGRLQRAVEQSSRDSGRRASLRLSGGGTRLDLALLEEVADLLETLLRRIVEEAVGRADIQRQLGLPDEVEVWLRVTRSGSRLAFVVGFPRPSQDAAPVLLNATLQERIRRLGGTASLVPGPEAWSLEMVLPSGVSVVRSYLCQAGKYLFAVPVVSVERAVDLPTARIRLSEGQSFWDEEGGESIPLVRFPRIPWTQADGNSRPGYPGLLYRVGPQRYALAVDAVLGETDVVVRSLKEGDARGQVAGMALMADGGIAIVPDLLNLARLR